MQPSIFERLTKLSPDRLRLLQQVQEQERRQREASQEASGDPHLPFPLSYSQKRIWRLLQKNPGLPLHQLCADVELRGKLEPRLFLNAVRTVIEKHPALRSQFFVPQDASARAPEGPVGPAPFQVSGLAPSVYLEAEVLQQMAINVDYQSLLTVVDPSTPQERLSESEYLNTLRELVSRPMDLRQGLPFQGLLVRLSEDCWRFAFVVHHLVCDGYALALVQREISEEYDRLAVCGSLDPSTAAGNPDSGRSVKDKSLRMHVQEEERWLQSPEGTAQAKFWRDYWVRQGDIPPLVFPRDVSGTTLGSGAGKSLPGIEGAGAAGVIHFSLPPDLVAFIELQSREWQITPAAMMLAAWKILLSKWFQEQTICVGLPYANRDWPGAWDQVGIYVNTLPMVSHIGKAQSIREFAQQIGRELLEISSQGKLPLEHVLLAADTSQRSAIASCLSQLFVWQSSWEHGHSRSYQASRIRLDCIPFTDTDLVLNVAPVPGGLELMLVYRQDRAAESRMQDAVRQYVTLLSEIQAQPKALVHALSGVCTAEMTELCRLSQGKSVSASAETIVDKIRGTARRVPDNLALEFAENAWRKENLDPQLAAAYAELGECTSVTYGQLLETAERIAARLRAYGVRANDPVAILLPRSPQLIAGIVGVLFSGGAFLVLDPGHPEQRLKDLVRQAGVSLVLTLNAYAPMFQGVVATLGWKQATDELTANPQSAQRAFVPRPQPQDVAYLISTSGSTGTPKLVEVLHAGLANHCECVEAISGIVAGERVSHSLSSSFDASLEEICPALTAGCVLVIHPDPRELAIPQLIQFVREYRISVLHLISTLFAPLAEYLSSPTAPRDHLQTFASVRLLITGGDVIMSQSARAWLHGPGRSTRLQYIYGVTEASIASMSCDVSEEDTKLDRLPIGRPIRGHSVWILDSDGTVLPKGAIGEIWIGGIGVAKGYRGMPSATEAKFRDIDLVPMGTVRLYRTGDRGRWRQDGQLEFLGRIDEQAKVRGWRIEPGEIQAALLAITGIADARVVVRTPPKQLVAYVVPREGSDLHAGKIQSLLRAKLPPPLIPSAIVMLSVLPRLASGKVDDKRLPAPAAVDAAEGRDLAPSSIPEGLNDIERALWDLWCRMLEMPPRSIQDDFFALGGDSILVMQLVHQVRQLGWEITPALVFRHPTIEQLAKVAQPVTLPSAATQGWPSSGILGPAQEMFFEWNLAVPEHFHQGVVVRLPRPWSFEIIKTAWQYLLARHPIMRSRFTRVHEAGRQAWRQQFPSNQHDTSDSNQEALSDTELKTYLRRRELQGDESTADVAAMQLEDLKRIDPFQGPISIAVWYDSLDSQQKQLLLAAHHLVVDAVSWRILLQEFEWVCQHLAAGQPPNLPAATTPYPHWAAAVETLSLPKSGWLPHPQLPAEALEMQRSLSCEIVLNAAETKRLLTSANASIRTQPEELIVAAIAKAGPELGLVGRLQLDLERHGRDPLGAFPDVSRSVGWFTRLLPLELDLPPNATRENIVDWVVAAKEGMRQALSPEAKLLTTESIDQARRCAPLSFNYLGQWRSKDTSQLEVIPLRSDDLSAPGNRRSHPFEILAFCEQGELHLQLTYSRDVLDEQQAWNFLESTRQYLVTIIQVCHEHGSSRLTPADLSGVRLSAKELESLNRLETRSIQHAFPVSAAQRMMLLHALAHPRDSMLQEQLVIHLQGELDSGLMRLAWERVVDRNAILRTHFIWDQLSEPLQVTRRSSRLSWQEYDLDGMEQEQLCARWREIKTDEHKRLIAMDSAPLFRVALVRRSSTDMIMLLTCHHLLLDGWSLPLLIEEVLACYVEIANGDSERRPKHKRAEFREFVLWEQGRDESAAEAWYRSEFATLIPDDSSKRKAGVRPVAFADAAEFAEVVHALNAGWLESLERAARQIRVSLGSLLLAAWSYVVAAATREDEVVMYVTISGRPMEFSGIGELLGPLAHPLPLPLVVSQQHRSLSAFIEHVHRKMADLNGFPSVTVADVARWCPQLGESPQWAGFVLENYPVGREIPQSRFRVTGVEGTVSSTLPFLLAVFPGEHPTARLRFSQSHCDTDRAHTLLTAWRDVLGEWAGHFSRQAVGTEAMEMVGFQDPSAWRDQRTGAAHLLADIVATVPIGKRQISEIRDSAPNYQPPRTLVEEQLQAIWQTVLGIEVVGVEDRFPDLGGTSLQSIQLLEQIEHVFGRRLPLMALYAEPTIAQHAKILASDEAPHLSNHSLVPLRPGVEDCPLYCIHPAGGTVFCYAELAKAIEPGRAVWGLQAYGVAGEGKPLESVAEMAASYIREMVASNPLGPFAICGWSSGGIVAFEVARQLLRDGHRLAEVVLFDTAIRPEGGEYTGDDMVTMLTLMFPDLSPEALVALREQDEKSVLDFFQQRAIQAGLVAPNGSTAHLAFVYEVFKSNARAVAAYQPEYLDWPLHVIRAEQEATQMHRDPWLGWKSLARSVCVRAVSGDHISMFQPPYVQQLAKLVTEIHQHS